MAKKQSTKKIEKDVKDIEVVQPILVTGTEQPDQEGEPLKLTGSKSPLSKNLRKLPQDNEL